MRADAVARLLWVLSAAVALPGLAVEVWHGFSHDPVVEALLPFLSPSYEANLPTWYASSLLFCCALLLSAIARAEERRAPWWGLAAGFFFMSIDEATELHEHLGGWLGTGGVLYFDWVIPAAAVVLLLGALYLPFLRRLPAITRRRFVAAGAVYLGGALLMELPLGWWTERHGDANLGYALIDVAEETLEMAGASLFLWALVAHRQEPGR